MAKKDSETHEPEVEDLEPVDEGQDDEIEDDDPGADEQAPEAEAPAPPQLPVPPLAVGFDQAVAAANIELAKGIRSGGRTVLDLDAITREQGTIPNLRDRVITAARLAGWDVAPQFGTNAVHIEPPPAEPI